MPDILELTRALTCSNWLFPFSLDSSDVLEKMLMFDIHTGAPSYPHLRSPYDDAAALHRMLLASEVCLDIVPMPCPARVAVSSFDWTGFTGIGTRWQVVRTRPVR